jgi:tRNA (cmo5U34)-methyltransferase
MSSGRMHIPSDWSFSLPDIAENFSSHVREQLPFYDIATLAISDLVRFYLPRCGTLVDVGASTGNISRSCADTISSRHATTISIEPSQEMALRFRGVGELVVCNAEDYEMPECDVVVSFLSLGFMAARFRREFVSKTMHRIRPGGAFIVVERSSSSGNHNAARHMIHAAKLRGGATAEDVVAKEASISGVLRPVDFRIFSPHNGWPFFSYADFQGYVFEAPE